MLNATGEHEVELLGLSYLIVGVWVGNFVLSAQFTKFGPRVVVKLEKCI